MRKINCLPILGFAILYVVTKLEPYYDILYFHVEGAMLYFRARKR